ncbi:MAG: sulfurtransferase [Arenimonas sp.]|nr:sulfurtransferase [Arenimonas sp.]MBP7917004.1 sulfurtransferase [Arenimonas sp.]
MTLISAQSLFNRLQDPALRIIDARYALSDTAQGLKDYRQSHLPGAWYVDLDGDLSGPKTNPLLGRHPLPGEAQFSTLLERLGIEPEQHVVVYDQSDGAMAASRLWFLLVLAGHRKVSVLDGGLNRWLEQDFPVTDVLPIPSVSQYPVLFDQSLLVDVMQLKRLLADPSAAALLDARASERFRGETEPLDKKAGHVPGALNRPFSQNLENGVFKSPERLRAEFTALIQGRKNIVLSCGSGVTACHNLLALSHAGIVGAKLFAPSWSGWVADDANPVAVGA